jgi:WD40 repeat protein
MEDDRRPSVRDLVTSFNELNNNPFLEEEPIIKSSPPPPPVPARPARRLSPSPPPLGPRPSQIILQRSDSAPITPSSPQRRAFQDNLQPDISQVSRTPPIARRLLNTAIHTKSQIKCFASSNSTMCTSSGQFNLKIWAVGRTDCIRKVNFDERSKITALCFVPSSHVDYLWVGFQTGELISINVNTGSTAERRTMHQGPITAIHQTSNRIYTLDSLGGLRIWNASEAGEFSLLGHCDAFRLRDQFIYSKISGSFLILAHQKWIEVFSLSQGTFGDFVKRFDVGLNISSLNCLASTDDGNLLFSGHDDGKVLMWNLVTMDLQTVFPLSVYRITSMVMNNKFLWIGYSTGKIQVVDYNRESWLIRKDFQSFGAAAVSLMESDLSSMVNSGLNLVISASDAGLIKLWDGNMMQDWIETELWKRQREYADFFDWNVMIFTWNVNSSKPTDEPHVFDAFLKSTSTVPEIIVVGMQEIVNLESGAVNARTSF